MSLNVTLIQHPVGQGGLMSGDITIPGGHFRWAYDCGSNQVDALNREIASLEGRGDLHILFLSHLDSDHVNGVDRLLAQYSVEEVVLPYLDDNDRLLAVAQDLSSGTLNGSFLEFLADVPAWMASRGVKRITFIVPRSDDDSPDEVGPEFPTDPSDVGEGPINVKWLDERGSAQQARVASSMTTREVHTQKLATSSSLLLHSSSRPLDWAFLPFAHRPSPRKARMFHAALSAKFGRAYRSKAFFADIIRDKKKRTALREAYELIWSDHNLVSMALYSGPVSNVDWQGETGTYGIRHWRHFYRRSGAVGWLCTGDMNLKAASRRRSFLKHYEKVLNQVNVFALPHHGSYLNFHREIPLAMTRLTQVLAASGPNSFGHPHQSVVDSIASLGHQFVLVSENAGTRLEWSHRS